MKIKKAVITCAGPNQRKLPLQTLIDRDGIGKSVLEVLVEEILEAGIDNIGCVVFPEDKKAYSDIVGDFKRYIEFIHQDKPKGYGHAILQAAEFVGDEPFLHLVGDHLYVSRSEKGCAEHLVAIAEKEKCSISAVSAIRESSMPNYGVIGGKRIKASKDLYAVDTVVEKPTPTEAEQSLLIPGLRSGHYLCFFGMHVLTSTVFKILKSQLEKMAKDEKLSLSQALKELSRHEKYLALEKRDWRYDVGTKYGLLKAQVALAMSGDDRDQVLSELLELFTSRELGKTGR